MNELHLSGDKLCTWCSKPVTPRLTGGKPQRFCTARCRTAFWTALRVWALHKFATGQVTVLDLSNALAAAAAVSTPSPEFKASAPPAADDKSFAQGDLIARCGDLDQDPARREAA